MLKQLTKKSRGGKPAKPHKDYPLFAHPDRQWARTADRDSGELSPRMWQDYYDACKMAIAEFGGNRLVTDLRPADFEKFRPKRSRKWGMWRVGKIIQL